MSFGFSTEVIPLTVDFPGVDISWMDDEEDTPDEW